MSTSRNRKKARRLCVDGETFLWRVKHGHIVTGQYRGCTEILQLRRFRAPGRLTLTFAPGPGRDVGGYPGTSGAIFLDGAGWLNLHEPGTTRAFLDDALASGWDPGSPAQEERDGWPMFEKVAARRPAATT